ncbi:MAG TPA: PP2C family serine/threonine-protein phosphatase [Thermoanaerobaculia bacterium]|nr:PP2C family serine/threonine-protein phosphatase [Thermoanaerobaculia bacterium]
MNQFTWRFVLASEIGTAHARLTTPCQDASICDVVPHEADGPVLVALISDGAGSADKSDIGSQLACRIAWREISARLESIASVAHLDRGFADHLLQTIKDELDAKAALDGLETREYACTLLAAIVGAHSATFIQVGDGAIVVSAEGEDGEYSWVFWPSTIEYENVTVFVTDVRAAYYLAFVNAPQAITELALFSDGLQRLTLNYATRSAHLPFFRSMMAVLKVTPDGSIATLYPALRQFLNSPQVNERTDDDKSLILAIRTQCA